MGISGFLLYHSYLGPGGMPIISIPSIGSLHIFRNLARLDISIVILLGNQVDSAPIITTILPRSLKLLSLRTDNVAWWHWSPAKLQPHFEALARDRNLLPQLATLDLAQLYVGPNLTTMDIITFRARARKTLTPVFAKTGIEVVFSRY